MSPYIWAIRTLMQGYSKHSFVYLNSAKQPLQELLLGSYWSSSGRSESAAEPWRVRAPASSLLLCSGRTEDVATTYFISVKMKQIGSIALNTRYSLLPTLAASLNSSWCLNLLFGSLHPPTLHFFPRFLLCYGACNYENWTSEHCGGLQKMNQKGFFGLFLENYFNF